VQLSENVGVIGVVGVVGLEGGTGGAGVFLITKIYNVIQPEITRKDINIKISSLHLELFFFNSL
jgi:hypothetical protein